MTSVSLTFTLFLCSLPGRGGGGGASLEARLHVQLEPNRLFKHGLDI